MRKDLTKRIWIRLKLDRKERQSVKLNALLASKKGKGDLARLLDVPMKCKHIIAITDSSGKKHHDKDDILKVFATFYENLYHAASTDLCFSGANAQHVAVTAEEVKKCLAKLRAGKFCGDDGSYA